MVYNLGVAHYLQLHKNTESRWQALRDRLFPIQGDRQFGYVSKFRRGRAGRSATGARRAEGRVASCRRRLVRADWDRMTTTSVAAAEPDALDVIQEEARVIAQFFGIKQCEVAAEMLVGRVAERLGGRRVYVAAKRVARDEQRARILKSFDGRNFAEVARAEGISPRQVRRIVYKATKK
jgi:Mor family transcriptional regulator